MPLDQTLASVPQAQTEGIARRLMGDDLVNRYGDVMGVRPYSAADALRDFTTGWQGGANKENADKLKMQIRNQFQTQYNKSQAAAIAQKQADVKNATSVIEAIKNVQALPPGHRAQILKETLDNAGIPYSNAAIKMFADSDLIAQLPMSEIEKQANDGTLDTATLGSVFGTALNAGKFMEAAANKKRYDQTTQNLVLDAELKNQQKRKNDADYQQALLMNPLKLKAEKLSIRNAHLTGEQRQYKIDHPSGSLLKDLIGGEVPGGPQSAAFVGSPATPPAEVAPDATKPTNVPETPQSPTAAAVGLPDQATVDAIKQKWNLGGSGQ